jgi:alkanesulfonate monooxygenase SsuD/methylene tetrahydromethanopterin reductase-like flavin-dependent oxidoreductase (luciferase family)
VRFGHYCVFQCPPWQEPGRVLAEELERAVLAEQLGFDDVWVPEQHFSPYLMARPLNPFVEQVEEFAHYRRTLEGRGLDPEPFLDRTTVLKYAFLAPSRDEARELARQALEWDIAILQELTTPTTTEMPTGYDLYEKLSGRLPELVYDDWVDNVLLFDDPAGCADKIAMLRDAGVRRLLLWVGPGGVDHDLAVRSMRLFAEQVMPLFRTPPR